MAKANSGDSITTLDDYFKRTLKAKRIVAASNLGKSQRIPHAMLNGVEHKSCSRCARLLPLDSFGVDKASVDGMKHCCKSCRKKA